MSKSKDVAAANSASRIVALSKAQAAIFAEALRRGQAAHANVETKLADYGRWLLANVFESDAANALEAKSRNPIWKSLLRAAGGPALGLSKRVLYVAVEIAARDSRIQDEAWSALDLGRKELLLPLANDAAMRKAAKRVVSSELSQSATRAYVASLREGAGKPVASRLTAARLIARLGKFRHSVTDANVAAHMENVVQSASEEQRAQMRRELDEVANWVLSFAQRLA